MPGADLPQMQGYYYGGNGYTGDPYFDPISYERAIQAGLGTAAAEQAGRAGYIANTLQAGGYSVPLAPTPGTTAAASYPTLNYPTPTEMWNDIYALPPYANQAAMLDEMRAAGMPYLAEQEAAIRAMQAQGMPYEAEMAALLGQGTQAIGGLQSYLGGLSSGGAPSISSHYSGDTGQNLQRYLRKLEREGLAYAPEQEAILQRMSSMDAFRSAVLPEVQGVMKGLGRSGLPSSSYADRAITDTLGSLYNNWQWKTLEGYGNLGNQMQAFQNALIGGYGNLGQLGNQAAANSIAAQTASANAYNQYMGNVMSGYNALANMYGTTQSGYNNLGTNVANFNQNMVNNWGNLGNNLSQWQGNMLGSYGNLGNQVTGAMPAFYAPYNQMLGYATA